VRVERLRVAAGVRIDWFDVRGRPWSGPTRRSTPVRAANRYRQAKLDGELGQVSGPAILSTNPRHDVVVIAVLMDVARGEQAFADSETDEMAPKSISIVTARSTATATSAASPLPAGVLALDTVQGSKRLRR